MINIVLITAKGGNTVIKNKNLIELGGRTLIGWQIEAAKHAKLVDEVFVSTECPLIKAEAQKYEVRVIDRPQELAQAFTNHGDVIIHGAMKANEILCNQIGIVTVLLGNTALNRGEDIDECIKTLKNNPNADSAMTVWKAQDDHPLRAMKIDKDGYLEGYSKQRDTDTNRQSYPDIYYYDQGPWSVRYESLMTSSHGKTGPACWWWMNDKCIPVIRNWVTGRDVHTWLDVEIARAWIEERLWEL